MSSPTEAVPLEDRLFVAGRRRSAWRPLPPFAKAATALGRELWSGAVAGQTNLIVLVVPQRSFVAWFICLGALDASLSASVDTVPQEVEVGSGVKVVFEGGVYDGVYLGLHERVVLGEHKRYHDVQVRGSGKMMFPEGQAELITVSQAGDGPRLGSFRPATPSDQLAFAAAALGLKDPVRFEAETEEVAAVIGVRSALSSELGYAELSVKDGPNRLSGSLNDLLRVRGPHSTSGWRVDLQTSLGDGAPGGDARLLVMDGALAVLRRGLDFDVRNLVVLVDPVDPSTPLALSELEQRAALSEQLQLPEALSHPGFGDIERAWLRT